MLVGLLLHSAWLRIGALIAEWINWVLWTVGIKASSIPSSFEDSGWIDVDIFGILNLCLCLMAQMWLVAAGPAFHLLYQLLCEQRGFWPISEKSDHHSFFCFSFLSPILSPWRIVDDCGGAFTMGTIGGGIFQAIKGFRNSPVVSGWMGSFYPGWKPLC